MSNKTDYIKARIEPNLKDKVNKILKHLGLTPSEALNIFYNQILLNKGLPFDIKIPNKETLDTIQHVEQGKHLTICKNSQDMFDKLGI